jgi:hypothetical protein
MCGFSLELFQQKSFVDPRKTTMSNLTLRRPAAPAVPASFIEALKELFAATPLAVAIAAFKR